MPDDPTTATALPPIVTVGSRPSRRGAENGSGEGEGMRGAGRRVRHLVRGALALDLVAHDERLRHLRLLVG